LRIRTVIPLKHLIYKGLLIDRALFFETYMPLKPNYQIIIIIIVVDENSLESGSRGVCVIFLLAAVVDVADGLIVTAELTT